MEVASQICVGGIPHLIGVQRTPIRDSLAGVCEQKFCQPVHGSLKFCLFDVKIIVIQRMFVIKCGVKYVLLCG